MVRLCTLALLFLFVSASAATAGIYGIVAGQVLDENKQPITGATVLVEGTKRGTYTKATGKFTIVKLLAGSYTLTVKSIGWTTYSTSITITADQTTMVDISLSASTQSTESHTVTSQQAWTVTSQQAWTVTSQQASWITLSVSDSTRDGTVSETVTIPTSAIVEAMARQSCGMRIDTDGYSFNEAEIFNMDGLDINDQCISGLGETTTTYFFTAGAKNRRNTDVLMGGYAAEYGYALPHILPIAGQQCKEPAIEVSRPFIIVK